MKCLDCPYMACKVFYLKADRWEGLCVNPICEKYQNKVYGDSSCTTIIL